MNICAGSFGYLELMIMIVFCIAISSALKHVCKLGSRFDSWMLVLIGLYIL